MPSVFALGVSVARHSTIARYCPLVILTGPSSFISRNPRQFSQCRTAESYLPALKRKKRRVSATGETDQREKENTTKIEILLGSRAFLVMGDKGRANIVQNFILYIFGQSCAVPVREDVLQPRRVLLPLPLLRGPLIPATGGIIRFHGSSDLVRELVLQCANTRVFPFQVRRRFLDEIWNEAYQEV